MCEHGKPEVFNSNHGKPNSPAKPALECSKREAITIDKDRRGQAFDNIFVERLWRCVKHEDLYLNDYATLGGLLMR